MSLVSILPPGFLSSLWYPNFYSTLTPSRFGFDSPVHPLCTGRYVWNFGKMPQSLKHIVNRKKKNPNESHDGTPLELSTRQRKQKKRVSSGFSLIFHVNCHCNKHFRFCGPVTIFFNATCHTTLTKKRLPHLDRVPSHNPSRGRERQRPRENTAKLRAHGNAVFRLPPGGHRYRWTAAHAGKIAVDGVFQGFPSCGVAFVRGGWGGYSIRAWP